VLRPTLLDLPAAACRVILAASTIVLDKRNASAIADRGAERAEGVSILASTDSVGRGRPNHLAEAGESVGRGWPENLAEANLIIITRGATRGRCTLGGEYTLLWWWAS
jgi:hypothetical protein